ncbi:MAG: hypothetical protein SAJ72_24725, partial [Jaaginema sp. PMC 1080.18]|nr:hypothetical protein [Jaaginema sp. PMC 1080.18]
MPDFITKFSSANNSIQDYIHIKNKVDKFNNMVLTGQPAKLFLNTQDINNLMCQGGNFDKYQPGQYKYYQIESECILVHSLKWPAVYGLSSIESVKISLSFLKESGVFFEIKEFLSINDRPYKRQNTKSTLFYSEFIFKVLGYSQSIFI